MPVIVAFSGHTHWSILRLILRSIQHLPTNLLNNLRDFSFIYYIPKEMYLNKTFLNLLPLYSLYTDKYYMLWSEYTFLWILAIVPKYHDM